MGGKAGPEARAGPAVGVRAAGGAAADAAAGAGGPVPVPVAVPVLALLAGPEPAIGLSVSSPPSPPGSAFKRDRVGRVEAEEQGAGFGCAL